MKQTSGNEASVNSPKWVIISIVSFLLFCFCLTSLIFCYKASLEARTEELPPPETISDVEIMSAFDTAISKEADFVCSELIALPKHYWIPADAEFPPKPDQACLGKATSPADLQWLLDDASTLLNGQSTLFSPETELMPGSEITYYLDETIMALTWKQVFDNFVYTISEIKISDPSQLRRCIAGDTYGSSELLTTSRMASSVNAVVASSGDFYMGRKHGISVYDGVVYKANHGKSVDTCFIGRNGDLIFAYRGEITDLESAQAFVDANDISFSLSFGPILVDNFERCEPDDYLLGEVNRGYPRAAICQMDELHYVLVAANWEMQYNSYPSIHTFASNIAALGCEKAYALDGGQTAVIVMGDQVINDVQFHFERKISDILYFATAYPDSF